jgi:HAE1 family hydrophobic/amphiphilic exporter-1
LALALTNTLNIFTILGIIMLIGLVCKMQLCWSIIPTSDEQQANRFELLIQTNHARLRPILMTTIAWFWYVPNCTSFWSRSRMEKRTGLGNY